MEGEINKLMHLKIMGDKGASRAVESLAMMLDMEVDMNIAAVNMASIYSIPEIVGNSEMVALFSKFNGAVSGTMFCLLNPESTLELASILLGDFTDEESDEMFNDMQKSAAIEIGNIITSSFVDVWADTFSIEISHDPPIFRYDFGDAIIDYALIDAARSGDFVIFFHSTLNVINKNINFNILMLPDPGNLQTIFDLFAKVEP